MWIESRETLQKTSSELVFKKFEFRGDQRNGWFLFIWVIVLRSSTEYLNSLDHPRYIFISKLYFRLIYLASTYISNNINYFNSFLRLQYSTIKVAWYTTHYHHLRSRKLNYESKLKFCKTSKWNYTSTAVTLVTFLQLARASNQSDSAKYQDQWVSKN